MEDQIIKILKSFKSIGPDEGFVKRSRQLILAASQIKRTFFFNSRASFFETFKLATGVVLAGVLLFVFLGGLSVFSAKVTGFAPMIVTDLNDEKLQSPDSNFHIELSRITYDLDPEKDIGAKIDEALDNLSL